MIMKKATFYFPEMAKALALAIIFTSGLNLTAFGQISFADDNPKGDSRKIRKEAAKYKADGVKESHLDMSHFSFKKGMPGKREEGELAYDEIYNAPNPIVKKERRFFKRKK